MRAGRWAAGLLLLLFIFLLVSAPARLLAWMLPAEQVVVQGFHGSLWSGRADNASFAVEGGYFQLGHVNWTLSPWSLLLFSLRLQLEAEWGQQRMEGDVSVSPGGDLRLRDTEMNLDASLVRQWLPIAVDGQLSVLIEDLSIEERQLAGGAARLVWQRARWYGTRGPQPLGDYVAEVEVGEPGEVSAIISTVSGPIEINGNASLFGRALTVDAKLTSASAFHPELAQTLGLMAEPIDGGFHLKINLDL